MEKATIQRRQTTVTLRRGCSVTTWMGWNPSETIMAEPCGSEWVPQDHPVLIFFHTGFYICQDINTHNSLLTGRSRSHGTKRCVLNSRREKSENISWKRFNGGCTELSWCLVFPVTDSKSPKAKKRSKKQEDHDYTDGKKVWAAVIYFFGWTLNEL